jgi:hypothetical protein
MLSDSRTTHGVGDSKRGQRAFHGTPEKPWNWQFLFLFKNWLQIWFQKHYINPGGTQFLINKHKNRGRFLFNGPPWKAPCPLLEQLQPMHRRSQIGARSGQRSHYNSGNIKAGEQKDHGRRAWTGHARSVAAVSSHWRERSLTLDYLQACNYSHNPSPLLPKLQTSATCTGRPCVHPIWSL